MRDAFVDVTFEVSALELASVGNPSQFVLEKMRDRADSLCFESGGRLRTDSAPEILVNQAVDREDGTEMVLCASRWPVVVPDRVL